MTRPAPIFRAPMRSRDRDAPAGAGARYGLEHGVVGIGDALETRPPTIEAAIDAASATHGEKAARMLRRFADLPDGTFVWTRSGPDDFHLGQISGPWRYDASPASTRVGIHHVRPTHWLDRSFDGGEVPAAVRQTFDRGGRNLQRTHDEEAERRTSELWSIFGPE